MTATVPNLKDSRDTYPLEVGELILIYIPQNLHCALLHMPAHGLVDLRTPATVW